MIVAGESMVDRLSDTYSSPACKLSRMVEKGEIIRLRRGLYETDPETPPYLVANCICEPSYISFEYALSWHSIIPERVNAVTNATYGKRRSKVFETPLGTFRYYDIPHAVFEMGSGGSNRVAASSSWRPLKKRSVTNYTRCHPRNPSEVSKR